MACRLAICGLGCVLHIVTGTIRERLRPGLQTGTQGVSASRGRQSHSGLSSQTRTPDRPDAIQGDRWVLGKTGRAFSPSWAPRSVRQVSRLLPREAPDSNLPTCGLTAGAASGVARRASGIACGLVRLLAEFNPSFMLRGAYRHNAPTDFRSRPGVRNPRASNPHPRAARYCSSVRPSTRPAAIS
jgi:hypothetical protein